MIWLLSYISLTISFPLRVHVRKVQMEYSPRSTRPWVLKQTLKLKRYDMILAHNGIKLEINMKKITGKSLNT